MTGLGALLASILPLCLVAAVSPVVLLKASSALSDGGRPAAHRFVTGNVAVLAVLGVASMGMLGSTTVSHAEREIASRAVDRFLGLVLICYACHLLLRLRRSLTAPPDDDASVMKGQFGLGAMGMATNFSTLPVFMSVSQRLGAADQPLVVKSLLLVLAIIIVAAPAWLPLLLARISPHHGGLSDQMRQRISEGTQVLTIGACFLGAVFLMVHGF